MHDPLKHSHTHIHTYRHQTHREKERAKAPQWQNTFLSLTSVSFIFLRVWLNQTEIFVRLFLRWNSGMCCFHVWGDPRGPCTQWDLCEEPLLAWCWEEVPAWRKAPALPFGWSCFLFAPSLAKLSETTYLSSVMGYHNSDLTENELICAQVVLLQFCTNVGVLSKRCYIHS